MPRLIIGLLVTDPTRFAGGTAGGMDGFKNAVQSAYALMRERQQQGGPASMLFVAPEYYFSRVSQNGDSIAPVSRSQKHDIYDELLRISQQNNGMIIVAGSIFYTKGGGCFSKTKGLSVCPVVQNGRFLHKYYKRNDDGNLGKHDDAAAYQTKADKSNPFFTADGISFGVEVCLDHNNHVLSDWMEHSGHASPDVHIVISGTTSVQMSSLKARLNGYVIHCDLLDAAQSSRVPRNRVAKMARDYVPGKNSMDDEVALQSLVLGDGSVIKLYDVTL